jgi:hypothetical protein
MANIYENIVNEFNKRNCKLLTTKEQHIEIINNSIKCNYKLNYIASCGHEHNVFYNVFKSRNTGIICPSCKSKENGKNKKDKMDNNEMSKTVNIEQEYKYIKSFQEIIKKDFISIKAFDGCNVDLIYKPNNILEDKWVGIQIKTTYARNLTYSFHINNIYKNCLILLYCIQDNVMWLIPENIIGNQKKISIGYTKSKYNIYKINDDCLTNKMNELYNSTNKFSFDILDNPTNFYQQREQIFRKFRQEKIKFINFEYDEMEGTVYDFKINNLKVQEKVAKICNKQNRYTFCLCKNNGSSKKIQYDIGDNQFYWLNCDDKKIFFVIPEKILIERGLIGNKIENSNNKNLHFTPNKNLHFRTMWLKPYMFNYETINEDIDKKRLLDLLI